MRAIPAPLHAKNPTHEHCRNRRGAVANRDDVSPWSGAQSIVNRAIEAFGDLHVLVNNAGIIRDRVLLNLTEQDWDDVIRVRLKGAFATSTWTATYWREPARLPPGSLTVRDQRTHAGCVHWPHINGRILMTDAATTFSPAQNGLEFNLPPTFDSLEAERQNRKERLAGALRLFGRLGFGEGVAGHITARDPELTDHFWVNPFGMSFRHVRVSDLLLVNHDGEVVHGRKPVNRAAFVIHAAVHAARADVVAAAHAHSVHGKAFSSLGKLLDPITQDACVFFEDHTLVTQGGGMVILEEDGGRALADGLGSCKAAIHQNHGLFTVGQSVDEAAWWFITMERSCQAQLLAEAAGTPKLIAREAALYTRGQTGFPLAGWFSFQPLWDEIARTDPDLFE